MKKIKMSSETHFLICFVFKKPWKGIMGHIFLSIFLILNKIHIISIKEGVIFTIYIRNRDTYNLIKFI